MTKDFYHSHDGIMTLEELKSKVKVKPKVWERIARLNPNGIKLGDKIRGYNPAHQFSKQLWLNIITVQEFIEYYGVEQYRMIPKSGFVRRGHRKAITKDYANGLRTLYQMAKENMKTIRVMREAIINGDL